jgi:predicted DNA-binding transcriptional regulator YafY
MYHPSTRLLTILELLQTRPVRGGAELAERLEVGPRTIRRYVTMLQDLGIPIETLRGPGGGYRLRPGFTLPPLLFSQEEAAAIVVGLIGMAGPLVDAAVPVTGALAKVVRVLPGSARTAVQGIAEHLSVETGLRGSRLDLALLLQLSAAAEHRQPVALVYGGEGGRVTERTVEPYGLGAWWGEWYLVAFCRMRQGLRTFRLDRIQSAAPLAEVFDRPEAFDSQAYLRLQIAHAGETSAVSVEFAAPIELVRRKVPHEFGELSSVPSGTRFETRHGKLRSVAFFLIGLDLPFIVLEPPALREELRQIAGRVSVAVGDGA